MRGDNRSNQHGQQIGHDDGCLPKPQPVEGEAQQRGSQQRQQAFEHIGHGKRKAPFRRAMRGIARLSGSVRNDVDIQRRRVGYQPVGERKAAGQPPAPRYAAPQHNARNA